MTYSLKLDHPDGGAKAKGFEQILGITLSDVDYLANTLREEVLNAVITNVRESALFGVTCGVRVPVMGLRERSDRVVAVTTGWQLCHADDRPRLVTAYISG